MFFRNVINQKEIRENLVQRARTGRISHALLFTGPEGSGKLATALAFAQFVNCLNPGGDDSCGTCSSCVKNKIFAHPDLHFIFPVNTSKEVKKDAVSDNYLTQWREALSESPYFNLQWWYDKMGIENKQGIIAKDEAGLVLRKLSLKAYEGRFKIMFIWCAEKMNTESANKLLKILEEPPDQTLFLLTTENAEDLLPTIVSRTQNVHLPPIKTEEVARALKEEFNLAEDNAWNCARLADGNYSYARELAGGVGEENDFTDLFVRWMRICWKPPMADLVKFVEELSGLGRERQKAFFAYCLHLVRESLNLHFGDKQLQRLTGPEEEFMLKFSQFINGVNGAAFMHEFGEAAYHIERNANPKIVFLDLSLKVVKLLRAKE